MLNLTQTRRILVAILARDGSFERRN